MRLHDRYLFRELLTPLACCLGGFLIFWLSYFFFTELGTLQEHKLTALESAEYAAAMLPGFFVTVLPITLLLALLYALTNHARHNEITALRAAGVSLWRLCAPYVLIGLFAGGIYFALNEVVVPRSVNWAEEVLNRHAEQPGNEVSAFIDTSQISRRPTVIHKAGTKAHFTKPGFHNAGERRIWQFADYDPATTEMLNPIVNWTLPDGGQRQLKAERGVFTNGVWTFFNAQLLFQAGAHSQLLPQDHASVLAFPEFKETPRQILLENKFSDTQSLRGTRSADIPLMELWEYQRHNPNLSPEIAAVLATKLQGRLAAPWTCLVVVLIAIPFGAQSGRKNLFYGVAGSIFICFIYFILQTVGMAFGMNGHLPAWLAAWLPNLFFAALGILLTARVR